MPRTLSRVVSTVVVAAVVVLAGPRASYGSDAVAADEATFWTLANQSRQAAGDAVVVRAGDLDAEARSHAQDMAAQARLFHTPDLQTRVTGWAALGEIVGADALADADPVAAVHQAFLASPTHREIMLSPGYTEVGVGVASNGTTMFVTEVFRTPRGSPAVAPTGSTAPPLTVRPSIAPRPAPVATRSPAPRAQAPSVAPAPAPRTHATAVPTVPDPVPPSPELLDDVPVLAPATALLVRPVSYSRDEAHAGFGWGWLAVGIVLAGGARLSVRRRRPSS